MSVSYKTNSVVIASGATQSSVLPSDGLRLVGIVMPDTMDGTIVAVYGGVSEDAMDPVYDDVGAPVQAVVSEGAYVLMTWALIRAPYLQLVSNASETADRTLKLVFEEEY